MIFCVCFWIYGKVTASWMTLVTPLCLSMMARSTNVLLFVPNDELRIVDSEWVIHIDMHIPQTECAITESDKQAEFFYNLTNSVVKLLNKSSSFCMLFSSIKNKFKPA